MGDAILQRWEGEVLHLTMNRPERLNAMDPELLEGLLEGLQLAEAEGARVVALAGAGRAFSAGADLVEFHRAEDTPQFVFHIAGLLNGVITRIRRLEAPVVALIRGAAVGAGFSLALACDLAVAEEGAIFNMGYMRIAFSPDAGATFLLPRILGLKAAMQLFLLTEDIDAFKAKELGLVNFVFPPGEFKDRSRELLHRLGELPRHAVAWTKRLVNDALFQGLEAHLERERVAVAELSGTDDFRKRLESFLRRKG